jgi:hypothetical protein
MANKIPDKISVSLTLPNLIRKDLWKAYFNEETNTAAMRCLLTTPISLIKPYWRGGRRSTK